MTKHDLYKMYADLCGPDDDTLTRNLVEVEAAALVYCAEFEQGYNENTIEGFWDALNPEWMWGDDHEHPFDDNRDIAYREAVRLILMGADNA